MSAALVIALALAALDRRSPEPRPPRAPDAAPRPEDAPAAAREARFVALLRSYPTRPPADSLAGVARLVDEGGFPSHARAEHWIASAWLSLGDGVAARAWFGRLGREHPETPWAERARLGLGDVAAAERGFGEAEARYAAAAAGPDPTVRALAASRIAQVRRLRRRQLGAWAAFAFAAAVALGWTGSALRRRPLALLPLPGELRLAGPVLALLALAALAQEPAARAAVLQICAAGGVLLALSGWRLRAARPRPWGRVLHALVALGALAASSYAILERADLLGGLEETLRSGPG